MTTTEATLDFFFRQAATDAGHAAPNATKSFLARERSGWTAHLKVDYDFAKTRPRAVETRRVATRLRREGFHAYMVRAYTTTKGLHLRVWLSKSSSENLDLNEARRVVLTATHTNALQADLRDDPGRVAFNAARIERGEQNWNVLWTSKRRNGKVVSAEVFSPEWTKKITRWFRP